MIEVLRYINEHIDEKLNLSDIASQYGYSVWYFCEKFKLYTGGVSFNEYVSKRRMYLATRELLNGVKIIDLAFKYGYSSVSGFNKAFQKEYDVAPAIFKKSVEEMEKQYQSNRLANEKRLTERCIALKHDFVTERSGVGNLCGQRMYYFLKGFYQVPKHERTPLNLMTASLVSVFDNFSPIIYENERIVGYNYVNDGLETAGYSIQSEQDVLSILDYFRNSLFTKSQIYSFIEAIRNPEDPYDPSYVLNFPYIETLYDTLTQREKNILDDLAVSSYYITNNHAVPDFQTVLEEGFQGIEEHIERIYDKKKKRGEINRESEVFYQSILSVCGAAGRIGMRYAEHARSLLSEQKEENKKSDLTQIIDTCSVVPYYPAQTFQQALQSIWFVHILNTWEDGINANSFGRLDQLLYPYYKKDMDSGALTKEEAFELLCCFFIKIYKEGIDVQQCTIGGCDAEGNDAVTELTYLMLDAIEALNIMRCMSVRYSDKTDLKFLQRVFEIIRYTQSGNPAFYNDNTLIPALRKQGISLEDARNYAIAGSAEVTIPGKANYHGVSTQCNVLKAIEYVMYNGHSILLGKKIGDTVCGLRTGDPVTFKSFLRFKNAVKRQIKYIIECACHFTEYLAPTVEYQNPLPIKSILTDGCIEKGKDYSENGAKYNYFLLAIAGFPNLIDSMLAVKNLVFKEHYYSMEQLIDILKNNYADEKEHHFIVGKAPKYGNDLAEANELAAEMFHYICDCVEEQSLSGVKFYPSFFSYWCIFEFGKKTGATPDGRHDGEMLAYSLMPMNGSDFNGYAALLNSLSKLPCQRAAGGATALIEVAPHLVSGNNLKRFLQAFMKASENGLSNTQFNILSEQGISSDSVIPVAGFSCNYALLESEMKEGNEMKEYVQKRTKLFT